MNIHKKTRLTPVQRKQLSDDFYEHHIRKCELTRKYQVSYPYGLQNTAKGQTERLQRPQEHQQAISVPRIRN